MSADSSNTTGISIIVPAYNATTFLQKSLPALLAMQARGEVLEVIVADDGSTDDTAAYAQAVGARVLFNPKRGGPGAARNFAAPRAKGDILWFVDADVIAHAGGAAQIAKAFEDPSVAAVHGSYDDQPPARNFMSQYKNLMHRYYHQRAQHEASTFWAGCGAVRKSAFLAVDGFDTKTFTRPSVEDIDLGYRLRANGWRLLLLKGLQGTHLKYWTLANAIETDIFARALPWSRLMIRREGLTDDLNVSTGERVRAGIAGLFLMSLFAAPFVSVGAWLTLFLFIAIFAANMPLFRFFLKRKGLLFALLALGYHQLYYVYSTTVFVFCMLEHRLGFGASRVKSAEA
jgi:glycosyltransferase involved in cell wall biosynthesis